MPETIIDLGRRVKAKYPEYADMDDAELGRRVKAKYPGAYDDFTDTPDNSAILQQQAAKYPTSAEQGGTPGQAQQAGLGWRIADAVMDTTGGDPNIKPMGIPAANAFISAAAPSNLVGRGASIAELRRGVKPGGITQQRAPDGFVDLVKQSPVGQMAKAGMGAADDLVQRAKQALSTEKGMQRSLGPTTLPMKGEARAIAPELAKRGEATLTQRRFDANMVQKAKNAGEAVRAAEDAVPHGTTLQRQPILEKLQGAIEELQIPGQGDEAISGHPDAIKSLTNLYNDIAKLPEQIPFKDLIKYRRQLDAAIDQASGFSETASAADRAAMLARKKAVGIIREQLNGASADLAKANKDFSLYQRAREIVERRELGKVGKPGVIGRAAPLIGKGAAGAIGAGGAFELGRRMFD